MAKAKLSDRARKRLIADRIDGASLRALSKKYKVSVTTVRNIINSDKEVAQKCTQKKEENTKEILEYMDTKKQIVCNLIDLYINELSCADKLEKASIREIATALGIVIDKFAGYKKEVSEQDSGGIIEIPLAEDGADENE